MKRTLFSFSGCLLAIITLFMVSCSKEGPAGAQGPAGPAGPAGPQGTQGIPGTSSVVYSDWLDVTYQQTVFSPGDTAFIANIPVTKLDLTMLNTGEIKVYFNYNTAASPQIWPLPFADIFGGLYIQPYFYVGNIQLESDANASTSAASGTKRFQYRYILIPGGTHARSGGINWNNYSEVKAYLGLTD